MSTERSRQRAKFLKNAQEINKLLELFGIGVGKDDDRVMTGGQVLTELLTRYGVKNECHPYAGGTPASTGATIFTPSQGRAPPLGKAYAPVSQSRGPSGTGRQYAAKRGTMLFYDRPQQFSPRGYSAGRGAEGKSCELESSSGATLRCKEHENHREQ